MRMPRPSCQFQNSTRSTVDSDAATIASTGHALVSPGTPQMPSARTPKAPMAATRSVYATGVRSGAGTSHDRSSEKTGSGAR